MENVDVGGPLLIPSNVTTVPEGKKKLFLGKKTNNMLVNLFRISGGHHFGNIVSPNTTYSNI